MLPENRLYHFLGRCFSYGAGNGNNLCFVKALYIMGGADICAADQAFSCFICFSDKKGMMIIARCVSDYEETVLFLCKSQGIIVILGGLRTSPVHEDGFFVKTFGVCCEA